MLRTLGAAALAALALAGCEKEQAVPAFVDGLSPDLAVAQETFDARVKERFRRGMPVAAVRSALAAEGFEVGAAKASLSRKIWCGQEVWAVRWDAAADATINEAWGVHGFECR